MKKLTLLTPVYYNEKSLDQHLREIYKFRDELQVVHNMDLEIIYVDDGSGDSSFEILKKIKSKYPQWVTIIKLSRNFGAMNAVSSGLNYVTGDCFCPIAADLQDSPSSILKMVESWKSGNKFSICVRKSRKDPFLTTIFSKIFNKLVRSFIIKTYPKNGYDLHLLDKSLLPLYKSRARNFNLQIYTYWLGFNPKIFYEERKQREHGKSRWTFRKKFKLMVDSFIGFSTAPLRIISTLALSVSFFSFLYCIVIFANALLGHVKVPGYATIVCLLSFLLGLVILMLTIIAEYIVRIYDEVTDKPEYVIEEVL